MTNHTIIRSAKDDVTLNISDTLSAIVGNVPVNHLHPLTFIIIQFHQFELTSFQLDSIIPKPFYGMQENALRILVNWCIISKDFIFSVFYVCKWRLLLTIFLANETYRNLRLFLKILFENQLAADKYRQLATIVFHVGVTLEQRSKSLQTLFQVLRCVQPNQLPSYFNTSPINNRK